MTSPAASMRPSEPPAPAGRVPRWLWWGLGVMSAVWGWAFALRVGGLLAAGLLTGVGLALLALVDQRRPDSPTWHLGSRWWLALPVLAVHLAVSYAAIPIVASILPFLDDQARALTAAASSGTSTVVVAAVSALVVVPMEEVLWRGTLQPRLGRQVLDRTRRRGLAAASDARRTTWSTIAVTTAWAVAFHVTTVNLALMGAALLGGIAWGWLRERTEGLVAPIVAHAGWTAAMALFPPG